MLILAFNQNISSWDVSNVTDMGGMFCNAQSFNQPIGNWDVSNVTRMNSMFGDADAFNQLIGDWDVYVVVTEYEWHQCFLYRYVISTKILSNWDVSNVDEYELICFCFAIFFQSSI